MAKLPTCCGLVSNLANKSATSWQQVFVMEFGKRHDTKHTTDFCLRCLRQLVTNLLWTCSLCRGLVTDLSFMLCYGLAIGKSRTCVGFVTGKLV